MGYGCFDHGDIGFLIGFLVLPITYVLLWALARLVVNKLPRPILTP